jgi:hypothetical protein
MKLWLDDQLDDNDVPARWTPAGWVGVKSALQACRLIATGKVTHLSLDHDLGPNRGTGYLVACFVEKHAHELPPMEWAIHSANPVGRERMARALENASRRWAMDESARTALPLFLSVDGAIGPVHPDLVASWDSSTAGAPCIRCGDKLELELTGLECPTCMREYAAARGCKCAGTNLCPECMARGATPSTRGVVVCEPGCSTLCPVCTPDD